MSFAKLSGIAIISGTMLVPGCDGPHGADGKTDQDTMHAHTNRLSHESSPYLLQHAHNPVDWYPWGDEAFAKAKTENKLVLVSIGYSSCHWCHVMERESFENDSVARIMNERFVCIKVDREERPDVDQVYMTAVQLMTGRGGWPLNCFTLPDGPPDWRDALARCDASLAERIDIVLLGDRDGVFGRSQEWVRLREVHVFWGGAEHAVEIHRADNVFRAMDERGVRHDADVSLEGCAADVDPLGAMLDSFDAGPAPELKMMDVGTGTIDFKTILAAGRKAGLKHWYIEHDNPTDDLASIKASAAALKKL